MNASLRVEHDPRLGWIVLDPRDRVLVIRRTEERARAFARHVRERTGLLLPRREAR